MIYSNYLRIYVCFLYIVGKGQMKDSIFLNFLADLVVIFT